jgi:hypothetical protein
MARGFYFVNAGVTDIMIVYRTASGSERDKESRWTMPLN